MYVTQDLSKALMSEAYFWDGLNCVFPIKCFGLGFRGNLKFGSLGEGHASMTQKNLVELSWTEFYIM